MRTQTPVPDSLSLRICLPEADFESRPVFARTAGTSGGQHVCLPVAQRLRMLAADEDASIKSLVMEGIDAILKERGGEALDPPGGAPKGAVKGFSGVLGFKACRVSWASTRHMEGAAGFGRRWGDLIFAVDRRL